MDVLSECDLYKVDFNKLSEFFEKSDLVRKLNGFIQSKIENKTNDFNRSILYNIKELIRVFSLSPSDGKLIIMIDKQLE